MILTPEQLKALIDLLTREEARLAKLAVSRTTAGRPDLGQKHLARAVGLRTIKKLLTATPAAQTTTA